MTEDVGATSVHDLKPNGRNIPVTKDNRIMVIGGFQRQTQSDANHQNAKVINSVEVLESGASSWVKQEYKAGPTFKSGYLVACMHPMSVQEALERHDLFGNAASKATKTNANVSKSSKKTKKALKA